MSLITASDYDAVRKALDVELDADTLSDDVIGLDIYAGAAERDVLARDPLAAVRSGVDAQRVRTAVILYTAAYLAPVLPRLTGEHHADYSYTRQAIDPDELAGTLRARANQELAIILEPNVPVTASRPPMFMAIAGRRGR